jgi:hypothetical protein
MVGVVHRFRTAPLSRQTLLLAAALLLIAQAVFGPAAMARAWSPTLGDLGSDIPICHSSALNEAESGTPAGQHEHGTDCVLCIVCHALGAAAVLTGPGASELAPPIVMVGRSASLPPARAPPGRVFLAAAYPTGPPLLD